MVHIARNLKQVSILLGWGRLRANRRHVCVTSDVSENFSPPLRTQQHFSKWSNKQLL